MKFEYIRYVAHKLEYNLVTSCGYKVLSLQRFDYGSYGECLLCEIINSDGDIKPFLYDHDGKLLDNKSNVASNLDGGPWKVNKHDLEIIMQKVERKWFNVHIGLYGNIESSTAYDTQEDAIKHKLLSDTDTISVITKILDDEED